MISYCNGPAACRHQGGGAAGDRRKEHLKEVDLQHAVILYVDRWAHSRFVAVIVFTDRRYVPGTRYVYAKNILTIPCITWHITWTFPAIHVNCPCTLAELYCSSLEGVLEAY